MSKLVDMKNEAEEEKGESAAVEASEPKEPDYPYGLRINLNHKGVEKLKLHGAKVGHKLHLRAHGHVTRVSQSEDMHGNGKHHDVEIQIHKMAVEHNPQSMQDAVDKGIEDGTD
jgi:hypothetical protein